MTSSLDMPASTKPGIRPASDAALAAVTAWVHEASITVSSEDEFAALVQAFGAGFRAGQREARRPAKCSRGESLAANTRRGGAPARA